MAKEICLRCIWTSLTIPCCANTWQMYGNDAKGRDVKKRTFLESCFIMLAVLDTKKRQNISSRFVWSPRLLGHFRLQKVTSRFECHKTRKLALVVVHEVIMQSDA